MIKPQRGTRTAAIALTMCGIGDLLVTRQATAAITADEFNKVINKTLEGFGPIVAQHGAELVIEGFYDTTSDGAMATRSRDQKKMVHSHVGRDAKVSECHPRYRNTHLVPRARPPLGRIPFLLPRFR